MSNVNDDGGPVFPVAEDHRIAARPYTQEPQRPPCDPGFCELDGAKDGNGETMGECPAGYCYKTPEPQR